MQIDNGQSSSSLGSGREKIEVALVRLKSYKYKVSELRAQCETLKKLRSEKNEDLQCKECRKPIAKDQQVTLKDSNGGVKGCYHKDCFREIWRSQDWKFDYSYPGFLKLSRKDY